MRIVGGEWRGRRIVAPKGDATRPTTDRTRETLFNILAHRLDIDGITALDVFAGSGALGLEALSRGAARAVFIDRSADAAAAISANIETLRALERTTVLRRDATRPGPPHGMADLVLADPPYGKGLGERALAALAKSGWLAPGATVVVEENALVAARIALPRGAFGAFRLDDTRRLGETALLFATFLPGDADEAAW